MTARFGDLTKLSCDVQHVSLGVWKHQLEVHHKDGENLSGLGVKLGADTLGQPRVWRVDEVPADCGTVLQVYTKRLLVEGPPLGLHRIRVHDEVHVNVVVTRLL